MAYFLFILMCLKVWLSYNIVSLLSFVFGFVLSVVSSLGLAWLLLWFGIVSWFLSVAVLAQLVFTVLRFLQFGQKHDCKTHDCNFKKI